MCFRSWEDTCPTSFVKRCELLVQMANVHVAVCVLDTKKTVYAFPSYFS